MRKPAEVGFPRRRAQLHLESDDRAVGRLADDVHLAPTGGAEVMKGDPLIESARLLQYFRRDEVLEEQAGDAGLVGEKPILVAAGQLAGEPAVRNPQLRPLDQLLSEVLTPRGRLDDEKQQLSLIHI